MKTSRLSNLAPRPPRRPPSLHHCRTPTARCPQGTRGLRAPVPRHPGPGGRAVSSRPRFCARALDRPAPGPRRSSPEVRPSSPREPATILLSPKAAREPAAHQGPRHPPWASSGSEPVGQGRPRALSTLGAPRGRQADTVPPASVCFSPRPLHSRGALCRADQEGGGSLRSRVPKELPQWSRPWGYWVLRWAPAPPCWAQGTGCKLQTRCAVPLRPQLPGSLTEGERPRPPGRASWQQSGRPRKPRTPRPAPAHLGMARETVTPPPQSQGRGAQGPQHVLACLWSVSPPGRPPRPWNAAGLGGRGDWPGRVEAGWTDRRLTE